MFTEQAEVCRTKAWGSVREIIRSCRWCLPRLFRLGKFRQIKDFSLAFAVLEG